MEKNVKKKMNQKAFVRLWTIIVALLIVIAIVATVLMQSFALTMDMVLGKGKKQMIQSEGSDNWDTIYYDNQYGSNEEALKGATAVARKVANEGIVLMKNEDAEGKALLPLKENTEVTPFGYHYLFPVYCPMGSASTANGYMDFSVSNSQSESFQSALKKNFIVNETIESKMSAAQPEVIDAAEGTTPCNIVPTPINCSGCQTQLTEYNPSVYLGSEESCSDTVGIVFIGRDTGEGGDLKWDGYTDGTPHMLALSQNELAEIKFAKENCHKGVVVVLNTANVMELGLLQEGEYAVDAIVWAGYPGSIGAMSLSDVLCGKVNPSGRTSDIYMSDILADPVTQNTGLFTYDDPQFTGDNKQSFIEYEEGIYHGYKYYETAAAVDPAFDYDKAVVYPFGYGLSYTTFEQKIESVTEKNGEIEVKVQVKNTGNCDGKEVVQLYYTAPYTDYDKKNKIEKSAKVLVAFDKVEVKKGKTETVTVTFAKEDMASYSYTHDNGDGTKGCYMLEEGDYTLTLGKNSHDAWDTASVKVASSVYYCGDNPREYEKLGQSIWDDEGNPTDVPARQMQDPVARFIAATNKFEDSNTYMNQDSVTILSRADWNGTFPTKPNEESRKLSPDVAETILAYGQHSFDYTSNAMLGNVENSLVYRKDAPVSGASNGLTVSDMRGVDYNDPRWNDLLDQIDYSSDQVWNLLFCGTYNISEVNSIGLVASANGEGPTGIGNMTKLLNSMGAVAGTKAAETVSYPCGSVLASTWNTELIHEMGMALAQECLNYQISNGTFAGMTCPSMNIRRSPFCGRDSEYFSEDPILAGKMASAQISGMADGGLYTIVKHFALNNQETGKTMNSGMCTWATEQTMREEYLKVYEIVFKETQKHVDYISDAAGNHSTKVMKGATGVMTSFNRVGAVPCGGSYSLITGVLRDEWGFDGIVQTDMPCQVNKDLLLRSGATIEMSFQLEQPQDISSPSMLWQVRRAVHDVAYVIANSAAVNGMAPGTTVKYGMSPWKIVLITVDVVIGVFACTMVAVMIIRGRDAKKNPEKYKVKQMKKIKAIPHITTKFVLRAATNKKSLP